MKTVKVPLIDGYKTLSVGDTVCVVNTNYNIPYVTTMYVKSIGNKYIALVHDMKSLRTVCQLIIETGKIKSSNISEHLYSSEESYKNWLMQQKTIDSVSAYLWTRGKINYEQAVKIAEILNINSK